MNVSSHLLEHGHGSSKWYKTMVSVMTSNFVKLARLLISLILLFKWVRMWSCANWNMGDIAAYLKSERLSINEIKLIPQELVELIAAIKNGTISGKIGKKVNFLHRSFLIRLPLLALWKRVINLCSSSTLYAFPNGVSSQSSIVLMSAVTCWASLQRWNRQIIDRRKGPSSGKWFNYLKKIVFLIYLYISLSWIYKHLIFFWCTVCWSPQWNVDIAFLVSKSCNFIESAISR